MVLSSELGRSNCLSGYLKATHLLNTGLSKTLMQTVSYETLVQYPFTVYLTTMTQVKPWNFWYDAFLPVVNKRAPLRRKNGKTSETAAMVNLRCNAGHDPS